MIRRWPVGHRFSMFADTFLRVKTVLRLQKYDKLIMYKYEYRIISCDTFFSYVRGTDEKEKHNSRSSYFCDCACNHYRCCGSVSDDNRFVKKRESTVSCRYCCQQHTGRDPEQGIHHKNAGD